MRLAYDTFDLEEYSEIFEGKFEPRNSHGRVEKDVGTRSAQVRVDRSVAVETRLAIGATVCCRCASDTRLGWRGQRNAMMRDRMWMAAATKAEKIAGPLRHEASSHL